MTARIVTIIACCLAVIGTAATPKLGGCYFNAILREQAVVAETGGRLRMEFENAARAIKLYQDEQKGLQRNRKQERQKERLETAWNRSRVKLTQHLTDCDICVISNGE
jgi:hypothetical protein